MHQNSEQPIKGRLWPKRLQNEKPTQTGVDWSEGALLLGVSTPETTVSLLKRPQATPHKCVLNISLFSFGRRNGHALQEDLGSMAPARGSERERER